MIRSFCIITYGCGYDLYRVYILYYCFRIYFYIYGCECDIYRIFFTGYSLQGILLYYYLQMRVWHLQGILSILYSVFFTGYSEYFLPGILLYSSCNALYSSVFNLYRCGCDSGAVWSPLPGGSDVLYYYVYFILSVIFFRCVTILYLICIFVYGLRVWPVECSGGLTGYIHCVLFGVWHVCSLCDGAVHLTSSFSLYNIFLVCVCACALIVLPGI